MSLTHSTAAPATAPAAGTTIGGNQWNEVHKIDITGPAVEIDTTSGGIFSVQESFGRRSILAWSPIPNSTSFTYSIIGSTAPNALGTATARAIATTNYFASGSRYGQVSAATTGSRAAVYFNLNQVWRGNAAKLGGFRYAARFGISDAAAVATANMFVGLVPNSTVGSGSTEPSASTNIIGIGHDSTDANMQLFTNDATGTATKTDLGALFPINTQNTDVYELLMYCAANDTKVVWKVTRLNTGDTTSGTITADLPVNTQLVYPMFMRGNMGTAAAVGIDVFDFYMSSDI